MVLTDTPFDDQTDATSGVFSIRGPYIIRQICLSLTALTQAILFYEQLVDYVHTGTRSLLVYVRVLLSIMVAVTIGVEAGSCVDGQTQPRCKITDM